MPCAPMSSQTRWTVSIASLDIAGRVELGRLVDVLGLSRPALLRGRVENGRLLLGAAPAEAPGGPEQPDGRAAPRRIGLPAYLRLDPLGRLRLPAGVRVRLGLTARGRALLAVDAAAGVLVVASPAVLDGMLDELVGGAR